MTRVLVVEDERGLRRALGINLKARGYEVTLVEDGRGALEAATRVRPEVVVLDLGLPDIDGVTVIEGLRGWTEAPIIVLSARGAEADVLARRPARALAGIRRIVAADRRLVRPEIGELRAVRGALAGSDVRPGIEDAGFRRQGKQIPYPCSHFFTSCP